MENLLAAFSLTLKEWRTIRTILIHLEQNGKSSKDLIDYINNKVAEGKRFQEEMTERLGKATRECSECSFSMSLYPVNDTPQTQTGDSTDKSVWLCRNKECMNTIYNKETVEELTKKGGT